MKGRVSFLSQCFLLAIHCAPHLRLPSLPQKVLECQTAVLQILPAVVCFDPDIIFISAGFDAHKKDDINFRYIGIAEKEYEWLTDQIVQVANR